MVITFKQSKYGIGMVDKGQVLNYIEKSPDRAWLLHP